LWIIHRYEYQMGCKIRCRKLRTASGQNKQENQKQFYRIYTQMDEIKSTLSGFRQVVISYDKNQISSDSDILRETQISQKYRYAKKNTTIFRQ
jgi:hypothetical protein